jgi:hypothetical protein
MRDFIEVFERARAIKRSLGVRVAAGFLRNQGISVEGAAWLLAHRHNG